MRSVFGKYFALCLTCIILEAIILITVLIEALKSTNSAARSLFYIISDWEIAFSVFRFITNWAEALSALTVCLVLIALFANSRKYRRKRALSRLYTWSKDMVLTLADYRQKVTSLEDSPLVRREKIRAMMDKLKAHYLTALADAQVLGGEMDVNTKRAVHAIFIIDNRVERLDVSVFDDLRTLQHALAEVMIAAFEALQSDKLTALRKKEARQGNQAENM